MILVTGCYSWEFSYLCLGSPPIRGDEEEDGVADDVASDFIYSSGSQNHRQKIAERMLSWKMNYGRGEDVGGPKYDRDEVPLTHIPSLANGQTVGQSINQSIYFYSCSSCFGDWSLHGVNLLFLLCFAVFRRITSGIS